MSDYGTLLNDYVYIFWYHWCNEHEFEQILGDSEGQGTWSAVVHGAGKIWTQLSEQQKCLL